VIGVALLYHSSGNLNISHEPGVYIKGHDFFSLSISNFKIYEHKTGNSIYDDGYRRIDFNAVHEGNCVVFIFFMAT